MFRAFHVQLTSFMDEAANLADRVPPAAPPRSRTAAHQEGILWMLFAVFLFVTMDAIAKHLVRTYPVAQVVWGRYTFHLLLLTILLGRRLPEVAATQRLGVQLLRSMLVLGTTILFFFGLRFVPLAEASAIMLVSPLIVTALSVPLLGEHVGAHRWAGVLVGFAGALVIMRPGAGLLAAPALLPLGAAGIYALYQITTRMLSRTDAPLTTLVYTPLVGTVAASAAVPFFWTSPDATGWGLMVLLGFLGGVSHFALIKAFQSSRAATIAPFGYTNLVWATLFGILFFGEYPDARTLVGAAIIVGSGLYIFHRERLRSSR